MATETWTPDLVAELDRLWRAGVRTLEIADRLCKIAPTSGISKNSVIGKARRLKLPGRPSPLTHTYPHVRRKATLQPGADL
jgi:GcrA cell cycle regulator